MGSFAIGLLLSTLMWTSLGVAQSRASALCVPGTTVCASADGHGGVQVTGTGNAQVTPSGATASGQADANANGAGRANGSASGSANANGGGDAPPVYSGGGSSGYGGYGGRYGFGLGVCPLLRVGVWSGIKAGGCLTLSFRFEGLTFEM